MNGDNYSSRGMPSQHSPAANPTDKAKGDGGRHGSSRSDYQVRYLPFSLLPCYPPPPGLVLMIALSRGSLPDTEMSDATEAIAATAGTGTGSATVATVAIELEPDAVPARQTTETGPAARRVM